MRFVVLVDNSLGRHEGLVVEHGFALWMEVDGLKYLVDTGASDAFARNATLLGIDISDVDYLILSHGHSDHCGGLESFLSLNDKAQIFISSHVMGNHYYSTRRGAKRDISLNHSLITANAHRLTMVDEGIEISNSVKIISSFANNHPMPLANGTLLVNDAHDDFTHEIALAITTSKGVVVISPCSHNGVINTIESCSHLGEVSHYIGGTHLVDNFESEEQLLNLASNLQQRYPNLTLLSGHCTGECAKRAFISSLKYKYIDFYTGFSLFID